LALTESAFCVIDGPTSGAIAWNCHSERSEESQSFSAAAHPPVPMVEPALVAPGDISPAQAYSGTGILPVRSVSRPDVSPKPYCISLPLPPRPDIVRRLMRDRRDAPNRLAQFREITHRQPQENGNNRHPHHRIQQKHERPGPSRLAIPAIARMSRRFVRQIDHFGATPPRSRGNARRPAAESRTSGRGSPAEWQIGSIADSKSCTEASGR